MKLPIFQSKEDQVSSVDFSLLQTKWASILNVLLGKSTSNSLIITAQVANGVNVINHLLGRKQQGWKVVDVDAAITLYRSAPFNASTLSLTASGTANISIEVF